MWGERLKLACMTAAGFQVESRLGPKLPITRMKALHVSRINTGTNRHDHRYADTQVLTLSRGCLILLQFSSRMSLFDTVYVCVLYYFPYE